MRQTSNLPGGGGTGLCLYRTVEPDDLSASLCQHSAAALAAARCSGDEGRSKGLLSGSYKQPSAPVAHLEGCGRTTNRARLLDLLEQAHLARPQRATRLEVDTNRQPNHHMNLAVSTQKTRRQFCADAARQH